MAIWLDLVIAARVIGVTFMNTLENYINTLKPTVNDELSEEKKKKTKR